LNSEVEIELIINVYLCLVITCTYSFSVSFCYKSFVEVFHQSYIHSYQLNQSQSPLLAYYLGPIRTVLAAKIEFLGSYMMVVFVVYFYYKLTQHMHDQMVLQKKVILVHLILSNYAKPNSFIPKSPLNH